MIKRLLLTLIFCLAFVSILWGIADHDIFWEDTRLSDTWIDESNADTKYGGADTLLCGRDKINPMTHKDYKMIFHFPGLNDSSLCDSLLNKLNLTLYQDTLASNYPANTFLDVYALRLGRSGDFVENDATWNDYDGTNSWGTAGCENTSTDIYPLRVGQKAADQDVGGVITITLVTLRDSLVDGSWESDALVVVFNIGEVPSDDYSGTFYSSEHATEALRPTLEYRFYDEAACYGGEESTNAQIITIIPWGLLYRLWY